MSLTECCLLNSLAYSPFRHTSKLLISQQDNSFNSVWVFTGSVIKSYSTPLGNSTERALKVQALTHWGHECVLYYISEVSVHSAELEVPPGPCHPPGIPGTSAAAAKTSSSDMTESTSQGKKVDWSFRKRLSLNRTVETILLCPSEIQLYVMFHYSISFRWVFNNIAIKLSINLLPALWGSKHPPTSFFRFPLQLASFSYLLPFQSLFFRPLIRQAAQSYTVSRKAANCIFKTAW